MFRDKEGSLDLSPRRDTLWTTLGCHHVIGCELGHEKNAGFIGVFGGKRWGKKNKVTWYAAGSRWLHTEYILWAPETMKNTGFGHLKSMLFTIKTSKHVGLGAHGLVDHCLPCITTSIYLIRPDEGLMMDEDPGSSIKGWCCWMLKKHAKYCNSASCWWHVDDMLMTCNDEATSC